MRKARLKGAPPALGVPCFGFGRNKECVQDAFRQQLQYGCTPPSSFLYSQLVCTAHRVESGSSLSIIQLFTPPLPRPSLSSFNYSILNRHTQVTLKRLRKNVDRLESLGDNRLDAKVSRIIAKYAEVSDFAQHADDRHPRTNCISFFLLSRTAEACVAAFWVPLRRGVVASA